MDNKTNDDILRKMVRMDTKVNSSRKNILVMFLCLFLGALFLGAGTFMYLRFWKRHLLVSGESVVLLSLPDLKKIVTIQPPGFNVLDMIFTSDRKYLLFLTAETKDANSPRWLCLWNLDTKEWVCNMCLLDKDCWNLVLDRDDRGCG